MKQPIKLIAIVGMPGAGKSEAAQFFHKKGLPILRFGDQTDIGLTELSKEINAKNERWYREKIRQELGMAAMAIKIEPRIIKTAEKFSTIILDGLYSWEEYVYLKSKFPDLKLLCIYAAPTVRYQRLSSRSIRSLTPEEAKDRDVAELEQLNKGGPIAVADYLIKNESNKNELHQELELFYQDVIKV